MKIITFGIRWNDPPKYDTAIDVRWARNPHNDKKLRYLSGLHPDVQAVMAKEENIQRAIQNISQDWLHNPPDFTLGIYCYSGRHRSVYIGQKVADIIKCEVEHRDIHRRAT